MRNVLKKKKNRLLIIDIMRSIGIIGVVIGHACNEYYFAGSFFTHGLRNFVYSYHLVIFAFCTGMLFTIKHEESIWLFIKQKLISYYIPFLKYAITLLMIKMIFCYFGFFAYSWLDILKQFIKILLFNIGGGIDGPLWFFQLLFILVCLYRVVSYLLEKMRIRWIGSIIIILILGCIGVYINNFYKPQYFRIDAALMMLPIIHSGRIYRKYQPDIIIKLKLAIPTVLGTSVALIYATCFKDVGIDIARGITLNPFVFYALSYTGIMWVISLSTVLLYFWRQERILAYIGESSAYIMAYHLFSFKIIDICITYLGGYDHQIIQLHPISYPKYRLIYVLVGLFIPLVIKNMNIKKGG